MRLLSGFCFIVIFTLPLALRIDAQTLDAHSLAASDPLLTWRSGVLDSRIPLPFTLPHGTSAIDGKPLLKTADLTLLTTVDVVATPRPADSTDGFEQRITPRQVETSAGTFGDPSRFIQTLAGVVSDNDQRNDFLVRGGNPSENAFVIDNIEVPSINQLALSDTTGGFVSMLDADAIQQLTLRTDAYDSKFDQRLSSIIDISTRREGKVDPHSLMELGIGGFGGSSSRPFGRDGSLFFSARQSVLQYVTNDIGLNGVPVYRNVFVRAEERIDERNNWWGMSLTGIDSIKIHPSPGDPDETSTIDVLYSGWRNTTGINWQHLFSVRSFGIASLAHSAQSQSILESDQLQSNAVVYNERSSDGVSTFKYDGTFQPTSFVTLTAGARESVDQVNYSVAQPIGLQNPYSSDPTPLNATSMVPQLCDRLLGSLRPGRLPASLPGQTRCGGARHAMVARRSHRIDTQGSFIHARLRQARPRRLCRVRAASFHPLSSQLQ